MPYASCLASAVWVGDYPIAQLVLRSSACHIILCLMQLTLSLGILFNGTLLVQRFRLLQPLLSRVFHIAP